MSAGPRLLTILRDEVETRAAAIAAQHPDWPCRKGCDYCCRSLAQLPEVTGPEWQEIEAGLALLPAAARGQISERWAAARGSAAPPYTCPFLEPDGGACLIYAHRPIACRTYGFYVDERGIGLYCGIIRARVDAGEWEDVVWGNHSALEARLDALGPCHNHVSSHEV